MTLKWIYNALIVKNLYVRWIYLANAQLLKKGAISSISDRAIRAILHNIRDDSNLSINNFLVGKFMGVERMHLEIKYCKC